MRVKKDLEKKIHGWLPKDPILPQKTYSKPTLPTPSNHTFARIGSAVLSAIGVFLISVYSFEYLFFDYSHFGLGMRWLFYGTYVLGIGITIAGLTLRQRFTSKSGLTIKKPSFLVSSLAFLSASVVGSLISGEIDIQFAMTHSVAQYYSASWNNPLMGAISFWVVGFAGWIILLWERKGAEWASTVKAMFYVLSAGVLLLFANALITALLFTSAQSVISSVAQLVFFDTLLAIPIGTLLLTCGWIFLLTTSLKLRTRSDKGKSL
jgi:hypothetical protein